jgi:hypothetical protein
MTLLPLDRAAAVPAPLDPVAQLPVPLGDQRLDTPAMLVDLDVAEANMAKAAGYAARAGLALRPHFKTHKSVALARRQLAAGAAGLCVATVGEAPGDGARHAVWRAYPPSRLSLLILALELGRGGGAWCVRRRW